MERLRRHYLHGNSPRSRPHPHAQAASACRSTRSRRRSTTRWRRRCPSRTSRRSSTSSTRTFPGDGPLLARYDEFRSAFVIPREKLDAVFQAAIKGCRERTLQHVKLPDSERFTVEYVTNKSWSGYNWYQGNLRSLIQVNTDLPVYIDRAVDLACHEGYPGPSRLQRAAREAPGARARLGRVLGLPAVLAAIADRGRHRQLRHRSGLSRPRTQQRSRRSVAVSRGRSRSGARRRVLPRAGSSTSSRTPATRPPAAI